MQSRPTLTSFVVLAAAVGAVSAVLAQDFVTFRDNPSQEIFVTSRAAVSHGEGSVANVKSLSMKGTAQVPHDSGMAASQVEIKILLPDAYLRIDRFADSVTISGFDGKRLLNAIQQGGSTDTPPANLVEPLLKNEKTRFTRLILGMYTGATPAMRLIGRTPPGVGGMSRPGTEGGSTSATFEAAGESHMVEFSGPENFYARFFVDASKMPSRIEYRAVKDEVWTTTYSDRRNVGGLLLPFHMVTNGRGGVREDLTLEEIKVNPELGRADFKVGS